VISLGYRAPFSIFKITLSRYHGTRPHAAKDSPFLPRTGSDELFGFSAVIRKLRAFREHFPAVVSGGKHFYDKPVSTDT
jgi:hypothetical protein